MQLRVTNCTLANIVRVYRPQRSIDLIGVEYIRGVTPDTEFPYTMSRIDLFVRFQVTDGCPTRIVFQVWWLNADGTNRQQVGRYPVLVPFSLMENYWEQPFRLPNLTLPGEGPYLVRVCRPRRNWKGRYLQTLANADFWVRREG